MVLQGERWTWLLLVQKLNMRLFWAKDVGTMVVGIAGLAIVLK